MEQGELDRRPLPASVRADAAQFGVSLEPATREELASVFTDEFSGSTAMNALQPNPYQPATGPRYAGPLRIYLAHDNDSDRLVYVVHRTINAVVRPDGSRDHGVNGLPREYLTILDVMSGDRLVEEELE